MNDSSALSPKRYATIKASLVTGFFALVFLYEGTRAVFQPDTELPVILFMGALLAHTFFSIRCFSAITPIDDVAQWVTDVSLVGCYVLLALSVGSPLSFFLWALALFLVAVAKYALLLSKGRYARELRYKIFVDSLGAAGCAIVAIGIWAGHPAVSLWMWTGSFLLASCYTFGINPLYRLSEGLEDKIIS